ncbi:MAG: PhnD/SsuA/transferrin family substrate-binding protein [Thermoanaerobaculia bacterium]
MSVVGVTALLFLAVAIPASGVSRWLVDHISRSQQIRSMDPSRQAEASRAQRGTLRGGIGAMISPQRTVMEYEDLYRLVARKLAMTPEIVQRRQYAEMNELLERGKVDFAWVCTGAVADLETRGLAIPLVAPVVSGAPRYRAYLIVRSDGRFSSLEDLRGHRFALTDPLSLTGRAVVVDQLRSIGETPDTYFRESFFTYAHDNSVRAVKRGLADGAMVDSLVYDLLAKRYPDEVKDLRIVWESEWFPTPPIMVSRREPEKMVRDLREAFTTLHEDPEGRAILAAIGIDRFVPIDSSSYVGR